MSEVRDEMMKRILSGKIVQAPTACYKAEPNGIVSDELIEFYSPRAENPVLDMIIVEHSFVAPRGQASPRQISLATPEVVEGLSRLASLIKDNGKVAFIQLAHAGGTAYRKVTRLVPWAPSSMVIGEAATGLGDPIPCAEMTKAISSSRSSSSPMLRCAQCKRASMVLRFMPHMPIS